MPRILHEAEFDGAAALLSGVQRATVGNLGLLRALAPDGEDSETPSPARRIDAHWSLNALNPWTVDALARLGVHTVWLSPELSERQVRSLVRSASAPVGIGIYGRQELMVTEHCVLMAEGECSRACAGCRRRAGVRWLKDRKGYRFPVRTDAQGRTHIYNSVPLDLTGSVPDVLATGVAAVRIDLPVEDAAEVAEVVARVRAALEAGALGQETRKSAGQTTTGHFYRGVS
jgi:putative protease